jgi:hypothetical protein
MPAYCEVALPVPLNRTFAYCVRVGQLPLQTARIFFRAPFRTSCRANFGV